MGFKLAVVSTRFSVGFNFSFLLIIINQIFYFISAMQGYVIKQKSHEYYNPSFYPLSSYSLMNIEHNAGSIIKYSLIALSNMFSMITPGLALLSSVK